MDMRQATKSEIRKLYTDQGFEVRISRDGHIEIRNGGEWTEGRWVEEYLTAEDGNVHHR
jgi:hypothetical protein